MSNSERKRRVWPLALAGLGGGLLLGCCLVVLLVGGRGLIRPDGASSRAVPEQASTPKPGTQGRPSDPRVLPLQRWRDKSSASSQSYASNGLVIVVNNVRRVVAADGILMPSDPSGPQDWIVVNLTLASGSSRPVNLSAFPVGLPMTITDQKGNSFSGDGDLLTDEEIQRLDEPLLFVQIDKLGPGGNDRLRPGQAIRGNIWFAVPSGSRGLHLQKVGLFGVDSQWRLEESGN